MDRITEAERAVGYRRLLDKIELGVDVRDAFDRENQGDPTSRWLTVVVRADLARNRAQAKAVQA